MHSTRILLLATAILGATLQASNAQSIGINLGSNRANSSLAPTDVAGVIPQNNWNNTGGANGSLVDLVDDSGAPSSADVTWASNEEWSVQGEVPADANGVLLNGFIAEFNNNPFASIDVTSIPYASYDLYVYVSHDRTSEDVIISEVSGAFPDFTAVYDDTDLNTAPVTFNQQTTSGVGSGNYVLFAGLSASTLNLSLQPVDLGPGTIDRNAISAVQIVASGPVDADGDGLLDAWELTFGLDPDDNGENPNNNGVPGDPNQGADGDPDMDGSLNLREQTQGSDPFEEDTDSDNLLDGVETGTGIWMNDGDRGTSPTNNDSDGDLLSDDIEDNGGVLVDPLTMTGTNPNLPDTDGDTLRDDWELDNSFDPIDNGDGDMDNGAAGDPDMDNSDNAEEQARGTDPNDDDSDDDTLLDGAETNDGNYVDATATGTDPLDADSDNDTLADNVEDNGGVVVGPDMTGTDPNLADTDGDGLRDDFELPSGRDPFDPADTILSDGGIALNFGAGRANASMVATDLAGVFAQENWNNLSAAGGGPVDLFDETGAASGASASWNMDEEWSDAGPGADANGVMLTGWFSANNGEAPNTIDITGIPYGSYDLVVYFNHDRNLEDVEISEANGAFPAFIAREINTDVGQPLSFIQQVASTADNPDEAGNFAIFESLSGATLNLVLASAGGDRGALTGLQIINRGAVDPSITGIELDQDDGTVTLTWTAVQGRLYAIDGCFDLEGEIDGLLDWQEIDDSIEATEGTASYTESGLDFTTTPRRFYRVREQPQQGP